MKDEFTRECLALEVATSMTSRAVRRVLEGLIATRGAPEYLRSDNGPEFIATHLTSWLQEVGSSSRFIEPGSPWQNGHAESFMSRLRAEFLNAEVFYNVADARLKLGLYRRFYNEERPHSALGNLTPADFGSRLPQHIRESPDLAKEHGCALGCGSGKDAQRPCLFSRPLKQRLKRHRKDAGI